MHPIFSLHTSKHYTFHFLFYLFFWEFFKGINVRLTLLVKLKIFSRQFLDLPFASDDDGNNGSKSSKGLPTCHKYEVVLVIILDLQ